MGFGFGGFNMIFTLVSMFVGIIFFIVIGTFIFRAVKGMGQWNTNNNSPLLTVNAKIISKRMSVSHHTRSHTGDNKSHHTTTSTSYYATFEVESGDRMELSVKGREYGLLAEGDQGKLSFQGTRYNRFERERPATSSNTFRRVSRAPADSTIEGDDQSAIEFFSSDSENSNSNK